MPAKKTPSKTAKAKPNKDIPVKEIPVKATAESVRPTAKTKTAAPAAFGRTNKLAAPLRERPLSPHLQIYRPQISSMLSILHRGTGVALYIGAFVLAALFVSLSYGAEVFGQVVALINHPVGQFAIFGWTFCLFYHFLNGIRHLAWDAGYGFQLRDMALTGWLVVILSFLLTTAALAYANPECVLKIIQTPGI